MAFKARQSGPVRPASGCGLNEAHDVTGAAQEDGGKFRVFYKPFGGTMQDLGELSGAASGRGLDVNANKLVVGDNYFDGTVYKAVLGVGGLTVPILVDLNNAASLGTFTTLMTATSANDADWIVGYGQDSSYNYRGFILRPNE
jgi:hypothetical protein